MVTLIPLLRPNAQARSHTFPQHTRLPVVPIQPLRSPIHLASPRQATPEVEWPAYLGWSLDGPCVAAAEVSEPWLDPAASCPSPVPTEVDEEDTVDDVFCDPDWDDELANADLTEAICRDVEDYIKREYLAGSSPVSSDVGDAADVDCVLTLEASPSPAAHYIVAAAATSVLGKRSHSDVADEDDGEAVEHASKRPCLSVVDEDNGIEEGSQDFDPEGLEEAFYAFAEIVGRNQPDSRCLSADEGMA